MTMLAFVAVPAVQEQEQKVTEKTLPKFKKRWWHSLNRLDARPVIWSLRNKPEDWKWHVEDYIVEHIPSKHLFVVSYGPAHLREASCSCNSDTSGRFQRFQSSGMKRAVKSWHRAHIMPERMKRLAGTAAQFHDHFVN